MKILKKIFSKKTRPELTVCKLTDGNFLVAYGDNRFVVSPTMMARTVSFSYQPDESGAKRGGRLYICSQRYQQQIEVPCKHEREARQIENRIRSATLARKTVAMPIWRIGTGVALGLMLSAIGLSLSLMLVGGMLLGTEFLLADSANKEAELSRAELSQTADSVETLDPQKRLSAQDMKNLRVLSPQIGIALTQHRQVPRDQAWEFYIFAQPDIQCRACKSVIEQAQEAPDPYLPVIIPSGIDADLGLALRAGLSLCDADPQRAWKTWSVDTRQPDALPRPAKECGKWVDRVKVAALLPVTFAVDPAYWPMTVAPNGKIHYGDWPDAGALRRWLLNNTK